MTDMQNKDQKVKEFYERLTQRLAEAQTAPSVPKELKNLIRKQDLIRIYDTLLQNEQLKKFLDNEQLIPIRWAKEDSHLARTVNIIFDPKTNDICLILETKSKIINSSGTTKKDFKNTPKFSGTYKTVKPAWRIDLLHPTKLANAVFYAETKSGLEDATTEALVPRKIATQEQTNTFLNLPAIGSKMNKAGIRSTNQKPYENKQSFYSEWANGGNLSTFLTSIAARALLSQRQMDELAIQLLTAVLAMHKKGLIHQDIKSENILLFQDKGGNYRLELSDFGITYDPAQPEKNKIPLATLQFESPEISAIHYYFSKEPNFNLPYFHDRSHESYGRDVFLSNKHSYRDKITADIEKFSSPSKENDMWAIGTVLHQLYNQGELPTQTNFAHFSPLIKGLLNKNREKRFTAEQALAYLQPHLSPTFPALSEPSTSTVPLPNTALAVHGGAGQTSKPSPVANNPLLPRGSTVLTDRLPPRAPKVLLPKASKLAERLPKVPSKAAPGPSSRVPKTKNKENDEQSPEKGNKPPWR